FGVSSLSLHDALPILDRHVEHLPRNEFPHAGREVAAAMLGVVAVNDERQSVHAFTVYEDVKPHEIAGSILEEIVIERRIAARHRDRKSTRLNSSHVKI